MCAADSEMSKGSGAGSRHTNVWRCARARSTEKILRMISERGKNQKPIERVYRLLYNEELWLLAYQNI